MVTKNIEVDDNHPNTIPVMIVAYPLSLIPGPAGTESKWEPTYSTRMSAHGQYYRSDTDERVVILMNM